VKINWPMQTRGDAMFVVVFYVALIGGAVLLFGKAVETGERNAEVAHQKAYTEASRSSGVHRPIYHTVVRQKVYERLVADGTPKSDARKLAFASLQDETIREVSKAVAGWEEPPATGPLIDFLKAHREEIMEIVLRLVVLLLLA
jgi:hypothetical protein